MLDYVLAHNQDSASNLADGLYQATRTPVQGDPHDEDITSVITKADRSM
jgi:hypothetical protein